MINVDKLCDIELPPAAPERQLQGAATTHDIYIYIYIYIYIHTSNICTDIDPKGLVRIRSRQTPR